MAFWKKLGFGQEQDNEPSPNDAETDSTPEPDERLIGRILDLIIELPNQALAIMLYRTALRLQETAKKTPDSDWVAEELDTAVSVLKNGLRLGAPSPMLLPPAAPPGASVILDVLLGKFRMSAYAFVEPSDDEDLMGDFLDAVSVAESVVLSLSPGDSSKLGQLIHKDGLLLRELFAAAAGGPAAEKVAALGNLWNPVAQETATSEIISLGHIAVLVEGDTVDEASLKATVTPKLCDLTGLTQSEIAKRSQIQVIRNSNEDIDRIEQGQAVGIVVATELAISLGNPDIATRFIDGELRSSEHLVNDDSTGSRYGIVVLHR